MVVNLFCGCYDIRGFQRRGFVLCKSLLGLRVWERGMCGRMCEWVILRNEWGGVWSIECADDFW